MKKYYTVIVLILIGCSSKREILFTGIICPSDSISVFIEESNVHLTAAPFRILKGAEKESVLDDHRSVKLGKSKLIRIKIDSTGINKLDTFIFIPDSFKRPNILFENPYITNWIRRVKLRDYSLVLKK